MNWINPVMLTIGPLELHWYGAMYALTFVIAYLLLQFSSLGKSLKLSTTEKDTFLIYVVLGIILGGRLGYVLFYNLPFYLENPAKIIAVWEGGMSFHGGLLGILIALIIFARQKKLPFLKLADTVSLIAPIGIFFGRLGNFINGELYGRVADNFCLYFATDPENCRYPSQLIEAALEGLLLFTILWFLAKYLKPHQGFISALFLCLYGIFRIIAEYYREPDPQLGFILGNFTMGQILSLIMTTGGIALFIVLKLKAKNGTMK